MLISEFMRLWESIAGFDNVLPDTSGNRAGVYHPELKRSSEFPYDRDTSYGLPGDYDRGSKGGALRGPIVPKNTEHSAWDEVEEAVGTPMFLSKGSQIGTATGVPGASGQWANNPLKAWDDLAVDDEALSWYGEERIVDTDERLSDLHDPAEFGGGASLPSQIRIVATDKKFKTGLGHSMGGRGTGHGLLPKESIWRRVEEALAEKGPDDDEEVRR